MAALDTVADYLAKARDLLMDKVAPYRYADADLVAALNAGIQESRRLRPDMWIGLARGAALPNYDPSSQSTSVQFDVQYRMALVYYVAGQAQLSDQEDTQDQRAMAFLGKFNNTLSGVSG